MTNLIEVQHSSTLRLQKLSNAELLEQISLRQKLIETLHTQQVKALIQSEIDKLYYVLDLKAVALAKGRRI